MVKKKKDQERPKVVTSQGQTKAAQGHKLTPTPKKGESSIKMKEVMGKQVMMPNAPYMPKPTSSAKHQKPSSNQKFKMGSMKKAKSGAGYKIKTKTPRCK